MNTLRERLLIALKKSEKTKTDIWKACGITSGAVSQWFSGAVQKLEGENLVKTASVLNVNPRWLATGDGEMNTNISSHYSIPVDSAPRPLVINDDEWKSLSPKTRALVEEIINKSSNKSLTEDDIKFLSSSLDHLTKK